MYAFIFTKILSFKDLDRYDDEVSLSRDEEQTLSLPREDGLISRGEHQTIREDEEEDSAISSLNTDISTASVRLLGASNILVFGQSYPDITQASMPDHTK